MKVCLSHELLTFLMMIAVGAAEGFIFDLFRVLRKNTCKSFAAVGVSDVLYWLVTAVVLVAALLHFTFGALRGYLFIGVAIGLIFYFLLLSRAVIWLFMKIIALILKIFKLIFKILLTPLTFLYKMLLVRVIAFLGRLFGRLSAKIKLCFFGMKKKKLFYKWKLRRKNDQKTKQK